MTLKSAKDNVISAMAIRTAASLCMALLIVGCSSGRDDSARTMAQDKTAGGDIQLHDCTQEEKYKIIEQANKEAGSEGKQYLEAMPSHAASAGLSFIPVVGSFLAGANNVRQETKEWTKSSSQKSIDVLAGATCDNHGNYVPSDAAKKMDKVNAVVNPLR